MGADALAMEQILTSMLNSVDLRSGLDRAGKMMQLEIITPDIAHVVVVGPTQCGKSIVLERIAQVLREEFGARLVNLEAQKNAPPEPNKLQSWERDMVRKTIWVLSEV